MIIAVVTALFMMTACSEENSWQVSSPGNLIRVEIFRENPVETGQLHYKVYVNRNG